METTGLVVAGKKLPVPRLLKRLLQVAIAVALTAGVFFVMIVGNGFLVGRGSTLQAGYNVWLAFIRRPDILTTMVLTAFITVLFVYWQRNQERRAGGSSRPSSLSS
jgi:Ni,Fe-hydrogenase I cytochrome b subunit